MALHFVCVALSLAVWLTLRQAIMVGNLCRVACTCGCSPAGAPSVGSSSGVGCRECGRLVSRRCNGGVHRTCAAARLAARPQPLHLPGTHPDEDLDRLLGSLPSLDEICATSIGTRDLVSSSLLPVAQKEFLRCVAQVLQHNCVDAWVQRHSGTEALSLGLAGVVHVSQNLSCSVAWGCRQEATEPPHLLQSP